MADTTFGYKEISPALEAEMEGRANATSVSGVVNAWHGARMPWIHIMSLSSACSSPYKELWSGNTSGTGYVEGYKRPEVIIEGVDVRKQGELGTTKKATIKMKAFTDEQINNISLCYLVMGMSVRVQYGWNLKADGTKVSGPIREDLLDNDAITRMIDRTNADPCYEGLQGRVVNYTISYNKEDCWDVVIEVVSAAATLATVRTKNYSMNCNCEEGSEASQDPTQNQGATPEQEAISNLEADLVELIDQKIPPSLTRKNLNKEVYRITYRGYDVDDKGVEDATGVLGGFAFWGYGDGIGNQTKTFITYRALEELITYTCQNMQQDGKPADFVLDSTGVLLSAPNIVLPAQDGLPAVNEKLFCADPRKAYIPGGSLVLNTYFDKYAKIPPQKPGSSFVESNKIDASKILINTLFARQLMASMTGEQDSVMDYLTNLWKAINQACGSPWEIALVSAKPQEGKPPIISIADIRGNSNRGQKIYEFKATAKASNVRELKIDLKLTEAMKTQALYINQATPPSTADACNNRFHAFAKAAGVVNKGAPINTAPPKSDCADSSGGKCTDKPKPNSFREKLDSLKDTGTEKGVTDRNVASIVADMIKGVSGKDQKAKNCKESPIPLELQITVDGVGGFRFGNGVSCDRLPTIYKDNLVHQVTSVEHSITPTDWATTINTLARLKPE